MVSFHGVLLLLFNPLTPSINNLFIITANYKNYADGTVNAQLEY